MSQLVEFCEDGRGEHILDVDSAGPLGVEEEEKLPDGGHYVLLLEVFIHVFEVYEGGNQFRNVFLEVGLSKIPVASCVI